MREDQIDIGVGDKLVGGDGAGVAGLPLHRGQRDDLDVREGSHFLLKTLLDVEGIRIAGVAEDLQHLALDRAVLGGQQLFGAASGDVADLDGAGHRGEGRRRRGDLAVELDHRNAGCHGGFDRGFQRIEIDGGEDDGRRLQGDDVVHLGLLHVGLVVGIQRLHLIADLLQKHLERRDRAGLELVEQRRDHVIDRALGLGDGRCQQGEGHCQDTEDGKKYSLHIVRSCLPDPVIRPVSLLVRHRPGFPR